MHEVDKIFVFLITLALTISGPSICQGNFPVEFRLPTSQPIATAWEMYYETSHVIGSTNATLTLTLTQILYHPSRSSLYLTRPNLDQMEQSTQCCIAHSPSVLLLFPITLPTPYSTEFPRSCSLTTSPCTLIDIPRNPFLAFFKNTIIIECVKLRLLVTDSTNSEERSQTKRHASTKDMDVL
jgi:hypothetical protein